MERSPPSASCTCAKNKPIRYDAPGLLRSGLAAAEPFGLVRLSQLSFLFLPVYFLSSLVQRAQPGVIMQFVSRSLEEKEMRIFYHRGEHIAAVITSGSANTGTDGVRDHNASMVVVSSSAPLLETVCVRRPSRAAVRDLICTRSDSVIESGEFVVQTLERLYCST